MTLAESIAAWIRRMNAERKPLPEFDSIYDKWIVRVSHDDRRDDEND